MTENQQGITRREYIIDIEKFDKKIERYVKGTFAFSQGEINETIEEIGIIVRKCISERTIIHPISSEPNYITVYDGSDKIWKPISMYELREIEAAINEECVGRNDGCPPGHLEEMHDAGNKVIDRVRNRGDLP